MAHVKLTSYFTFSIRARVHTFLARLARTRLCHSTEISHNRGQVFSDAHFYLGKCLISAFRKCVKLFFRLW